MDAYTPRSSLAHHEELEEEQSAEDAPVAQPLHGRLDRYGRAASAVVAATENNNGDTTVGAGS